MGAEEQLYTITVAMQLKAKAAKAGGPNVIPVSLPSFSFQSPDLCNMTVQRAWSGSQDYLPCAQQSVRDFFQLIAIGLSIHASDQLITLQAGDVLRRIPRNVERMSEESMLDFQLMRQYS